MIAVAGFTAPALATTVAFTGTVTSTTLFPDPNPFFPDLTGTNLHGTFTFDDAATDTSADPNFGHYASSGASYGGTLGGGGMSANIKGGTVYNEVTNGVPSNPTDQYLMLASVDNTTLGGIGSFALKLVIFLMDTTGAALTSDALVTPVIDNFNLTSFRLEVTDKTTNKTAIYEGVIPAVPLPAALPLALGGLGVLGFLGWRKRRTAPAVA